jgi:hypothetical protein
VDIRAPRRRFFFYFAFFSLDGHISGNGKDLIFTLYPTPSLSDFFLILLGSSRAECNNSVEGKRQNVFLFSAFRVSLGLPPFHLWD